MRRNPGRADTSRRPLFSVALCLCALSGCGRHYSADGLVLSIDRTQNRLTISHRAIPGLMPAMAMPFAVAHAHELDGLVPGQRVHFQLRAGRKSTSVSGIRPIRAAAPDFTLPRARDPLAIGDLVPEFTLRDQTGAAFPFSSLRGHWAAIEFIYTRCPLPDMCPRLSANFARLQKSFASSLALLSISVDPEHDTPPVLTEYAARWGARPEIWHFLTGSADDTQHVAGHFGVVYWPDEGTVSHTSILALVGPDGRLRAKLEGASYTQTELLDFVRQYVHP